VVSSNKPLEDQEPLPTPLRRVGERNWESSMQLEKGYKTPPPEMDDKVWNMTPPTVSPADRHLMNQQARILSTGTYSGPDRRQRSKSSFSKSTWDGFNRRRYTVDIYVGPEKRRNSPLYVGS
jgi:hypothetical protein